jgi:hypothetical protein
MFIENLIEELQKLLAENECLKAQVKTLLEDKEILCKLKDKLLTTPNEILVPQGDNNLIAQRDAALAIAKNCLGKLQTFGTTYRAKQALLEAELLRYQLNELNRKQAISLEEQNQKLSSKRSRLFGW